MTDIPKTTTVHITIWRDLFLNTVCGRNQYIKEFKSSIQKKFGFENEKKNNIGMMHDSYRNTRSWDVNE